MVYTVLFGTLFKRYSNYSKKSKEKQEKEEWDNLPKARPVDPDLFNPFSAIPFHNNPELKYRYANLNMFGYLDPKTHMNLKDYPYKAYHDSFDHNNEKQYLYNWVSMKPSDDVALLKMGQ